MIGRHRLCGCINGISLPNELGTIRDRADVGLYHAVMGGAEVVDRSKQPNKMVFTSRWLVGLHGDASPWAIVASENDDIGGAGV